MSIRNINNQTVFTIIKFNSENEMKIKVSIIEIKRR